MLQAIPSAFLMDEEEKKNPNLLSVFMSMIMTNNALNYVFIEMFLIILLLVVFGSERVFVSLCVCLGARARVF